MKKEINKEMMKVISKNLMIDMSDSELELLMDEVKSSINDLDKLSIFSSQKYNIKNYEPMNYPKINSNNKFREDNICEFENKEKLLKLANNAKKNLIKV